MTKPKPTPKKRPRDQLRGPAKSGRWYLAGKGYIHESEMKGRRSGS